MADEYHCLRCQNCYLSNAYPDLSDVTPGSPMGLTCIKGHWKFDEYETTKQVLAAYIEKASACPDWEAQP